MLTRNKHSNFLLTSIKSFIMLGPVDIVIKAFGITERAYQIKHLVTRPLILNSSIFNPHQALGKIRKPRKPIRKI